MKRKLLALFLCSLIFFFYLILMVPFRTPGGTPGGTPGIVILTMVLWFTWRFIVKTKPGALSGGIEEDKLPVTPFLLLGVAILYGMVLMYAGFLGIEGYAGGAGWAWAALVVGLMTRFTLPLTVGAFYAAHTLWHWHWALALVFAVPGIVFNLLMVPGFLASLLPNNRSDDKLPDEEARGPKEVNKTSGGTLAGYELLAAEKQQGSRHEALWLKCLSEADGDESMAIHSYNRERAKILEDESQIASMGATEVVDSGKATPMEGILLAFAVVAVCSLILLAGIVAFREYKKSVGEAMRSSKTTPDFSDERLEMESVPEDLERREDLSPSKQQMAPAKQMDVNRSTPEGQAGSIKSTSPATDTSNARLTMISRADFSAISIEGHPESLIRLADETEKIFQERLQAARQKGLDIRNEVVLRALTRAKFLELNSPQKAILDQSSTEFYDYCERKKGSDEVVLARVRKWISDEAWASQQRLEYIQNNPDYKPPVTTDARCEPRFLDSWILHKKDDLLFFWGTPAKVVPKEDGGEFLGYFKDDNFIEVFNTTTDGDIIYWETLVLTE